MFAPDWKRPESGSALASWRPGVDLEAELKLGKIPLWAGAWERRSRRSEPLSRWICAAPEDPSGSPTPLELTVAGG